MPKPIQMLWDRWQNTTQIQLLMDKWPILKFMPRVQRDIGKVANAKAHSNISELIQMQGVGGRSLNPIKCNGVKCTLLHSIQVV